MSTHTHYVKLTMETGNIADDEPHQEVIINQRTESSADNTMLQQAVTQAMAALFLQLGTDAIEAKGGGRGQGQGTR